MLNPSAVHRPSVFVALADTPASQRLHHRLRYQVYCQKLAYEDPTKFPDGEERDHYDDHSARFLAFDAHRGDWVGTLRLVPPGPAGLPLTSLTVLASNVVRMVEQRRVAEVSRMCVLAPDAGDGQSPGDRGRDCGSNALIFFALIRASVAYAFWNGFDYLTFLTTASLSRLLGRVGIADAPAGEACHHRGQRFPRIANTAHLYRSLIEAADAHPLSAKLARHPYVDFSTLSAPAGVGIPMVAVG